MRVQHLYLQYIIDSFKIPVNFSIFLLNFCAGAIFKISSFQTGLIYDKILRRRDLKHNYTELGRVKPLASIKKNVHAGHRERMRRRIREHGLETLQDHEVLEYMLYYIIPKRDVNPMAHELIERFGTLDAVLGAPAEALVEVDGVGMVTAGYLKAFGELVAAYDEDNQHFGTAIRTAAEAARYARNLFYRPDRREMAVLCMTAQDELIGSSLHDWSAFSPEAARWLLTAAIESSAHHIILVWKRTGKNPDLSRREDESIQEMLRLLRSMEIYLRDIVLLSEDNRYASLRGSGALLDGHDLASMNASAMKDAPDLPPIIEMSDADLLAKGLDEQAAKR